MPNIDTEYLATRDRDTVEFSQPDTVEHVTMWTDALGFARWSTVHASRGYECESFSNTHRS